MPWFQTKNAMTDEQMTMNNISPQPCNDICGTVCHPFSITEVTTSKIDPIIVVTVVVMSGDTSRITILPSNPCETQQINPPMNSRSPRLKSNCTMVAKDPCEITTRTPSNDKIRPSPTRLFHSSCKNKTAPIVIKTGLVAMINEPLIEIGRASCRARVKVPEGRSEENI